MADSTETLKFKIASKDRYTILKDLCVERWQGHASRDEIIQAIFQGNITVNGKKGKAKATYKPGMPVEWRSLKGKAHQPRAHNLDILLEDEHMVAVHKPPGMAVNGGRGEDLEGILSKFIQIQTRFEALEEVTAVHRIDVPTSGIVILAKTKEFLVDMGRLFAHQEVNKEYHALVYGNAPGKGRIDEDIDGKPSQSTFVKLRDVQMGKGQYSLLLVSPKTGRTHQIRKHLLTIEHPIAGDDMYYIPQQRHPRFKKLHLCASSIEFEHPISNEPIEIKAPLPHWAGKLL